MFGYIILFLRRGRREGEPSRSPTVRQITFERRKIRRRVVRSVLCPVFGGRREVKRREQMGREEKIRQDKTEV